MLGSNSLAHEFYGHLWLALKGVPWEHGGLLTRAHGVTDPFGRTYVGTTDIYISSFAGATQTALQSPTLRVSTAHLDASLQWLSQNGPAALTLTPTGAGQATSGFALHWEVVSQNYEALRVGPQPTTAAPNLDSAAEVLDWVLRWFQTSLDDTQKRAFRSVLGGTLTGLNRGRQTRLASDVRDRIP